jgi:hypothetical protein
MKRCRRAELRVEFRGWHEFYADSASCRACQIRSWTGGDRLSCGFQWATSLPMLGVRNPAELLWTAPRRRAPGPGDRILRRHSLSAGSSLPPSSFWLNPLATTSWLSFSTRSAKELNGLNGNAKGLLKGLAFSSPGTQASRAAYHHQDIARQQVLGRWRRRWVIHEPRHVGGKRARPQM